MNLALLAATLLLLVILADTLIGRYVHYGLTTRQSPNARYTVDNDAYRYEVRLNSDGFRESELPTRPFTGDKRVVMVGDSMLFGQGVARGESFARIAAAELKASDDSDWEFINLGIPGAGPNEYRDVLASFGEQLQPDVVIACYYAGNDALHRDYPLKDNLRRPRLWDNLRAGKPIHLLELAKRALSIVRSKTPEHARPGSITPNPLSPYLDDTLPEFATRVASLDPAVVQRGLDWRVNPGLIVQAIREPDLLGYHLRQNTMLYEKSINQDLLSELHERSTALGAEFRVVIIPAGYTLNRAMWPFLESVGFETDERLLKEDRFEESIRYFCKVRNIACLDLRDAMLRAESPLFFSEDTHMNAAGHRLVGESIASWLAGKRIPLPVASPIAVETIRTIARWDFTDVSDAAAWKLIGSGAALEVGTAGLRIQNGDDFARIVQHGVPLDTDAANRLRIRMRTDAGHAARFFWGPEARVDGQHFEQERSATFPVLSDGRFHEYVIDLDHAVSDYSGHWPRLRFDPVLSPGERRAWTAEIAWIELAHATPQPDPINPWVRPPFVEGRTQ